MSKDKKQDRLPTQEEFGYEQAPLLLEDVKDLDQQKLNETIKRLEALNKRPLKKPEGK